MRAISLLLASLVLGVPLASAPSVVAGALAETTGTRQSVQRLVKSSDGQTLEGWTRSDAPGSYRLEPQDAALREATIWYQQVDLQDLDRAFMTAAAAEGFSEFNILARAPIRKAELLDREGSGQVVIGAGIRRGKPANAIAVVLYGSLDDSPRRSGVHAFAAPTQLYARLGGWVPPAAFWYDLETARQIKSPNAEGQLSPQEQAQKLAQISDIWIQYAFDRFVRQSAANLRALNDARVMAVCGADAVIGANGWLECR